MLPSSGSMIESIPKDQWTKEIKELNMTKDLLPVEEPRVFNCVFSHTTFKLDRPLMRHGILLTVSSIYDPLGLIAPFLLQGKHILQAICKDGVHWDDPVPRPHRNLEVGDVVILNDDNLPRNCWKLAQINETYPMA